MLTTPCIGDKVTCHAVKSISLPTNPRNQQFSLLFTGICAKDERFFFADLYIHIYTECYSDTASVCYILLYRYASWWRVSASAASSTQIVPKVVRFLCTWRSGRTQLYICHCLPDKTASSSPAQPVSVYYPVKYFTKICCAFMK